MFVLFELFTGHTARLFVALVSFLDYFHTTSQHAQHVTKGMGEGTFEEVGSVRGERKRWG